MVSFAAVLGGGWVLSNTWLDVYLQWILTVGFQVLIFALVLAIMGFMFFLAVSAVSFLIGAVKALFSRKKNDDD